MSENNSSLPQLNQGDPSDLSRPVRSRQAQELESKPIKPGKLSSPFAASGVLKMDAAPGQTFANNPLSGTIDAPTIAGTQGFMGDITAPNERDSWFDDTSVGANLIMTGGNVNDPRLNSQMSNQAKFLNDQMKIWETSGDRARNAIFGGALQGINRIGEDIGGILGGSFWGEDFEKSAMERYFANSRPTYETQTKIYDQDAKFWQGTQAVVSSIVEFAPVGGAVTKGFSLGAKAVKGVAGAVRGAKAARATTKFSEAIARGTRVSEAVAQNSSRLGNFYKKFQNPINQVGTAVPAGIVQNRIEGTAMGLQTYNEVLEELTPLIDSGELSYEQAAKIASDAGNSVRATNSSMMLQDIFQHATLFRARGLTRTGYQRPGFTWNPKQYLKNAFKSRKSAWNYGTNNFIVQGIGEGLEEGLQSGIQQDAITNAKRAGREILRETGDVTKLSIDNLATATKSNVLDRYLDYMSTDDAKFEMAIGFFAGGGQRMVQSYTEKAFDGSKYRKFTKEIEAVKKNLPSGTDEEATYKRQKIEELEYKRSIETERGRSEAAQELLNNLSGDVANSIKFAMETDDLLEAVQKKGMEHLASGIEKNAFYNLFMKHAQNGTVDQLERQLQAIADGSSTSAIFPGDGSAKQKASEFLKELNGLEGDYLSVQNMEGAHTIMGKQFLTQTNERIIDDAIAARSTAKAKVIEDLRRISKSKATSIELDEETGKVTLKDSQGRELKLSKALEKAMQASEEYLEIFGEGGFNDQIDAIKDRVIADRISLADMISDSGQFKIKEERKEFEKELERLRKVERKKGRTHSRKGKTKGQRDASNLDNQQRRANDAQTRMEGDEITSKATMSPQGNNPSPSDENPNPRSTQEIKDLFEPGKDSLDIKSDKEIQEAAEGTFESTQTDPKYGYNRGRKSNLNKVATLLRQWNATVNKGVIFLNDADFKFIDGYMSLSDPTSVQEGDELIFEVVSDEEAGDYPVTDVSDLDATNQGKKTTVKEVRANRKKSLAGHESAISQTKISEDQIIKDTQPIKIWHVSKDGTKKLIGFVHTPLYEREARQDQKEGEDRKDYNERIAEYKQKIREFRDKLINGDVKSTRISEINAVILNYISKDNRQSTAKTFNGVDSSKYTIALSRTNGELFTNSVDEDGKGASVGIQSKAGIGRNSVIINQKDVQAGMAYVVVPLKKDEKGNIHYYAAPLLTRTVTDNNVAVMQTAIKNWISSTNVEGLQSNMTAKDVRNLKTVLKRFIRIRSTSSLPNKPNQSYVYEKEVEGKKVLVFAKVLTKASEGNNGIYEVALEKDMPLSEANLKFVKDVLAAQMGNMDFDSIDSNEHYHSTVDKDGNVTTTKKSFTDHVMENTLSTIGPVRAEVKQGQTQGELPNGRAIFHYNPEIRYVVEGVEGTEAQEKPPLKKDDDLQPGMDDDLAAIAALAESLKITEDQVKDDMEAAELLAEEEEEEDNPLDEGDDGTLGLLPESATKRTEETRNKHRLPNISAVEQEQIVGHFASDVIAQLKIILDNAQVERSDKDSFDLAVDETYQQLLRNMEALQKRTRALITAANKFNKTDLAKKYENRRKKIEKIITSLRNNDEKLIDLAMTRLDTQSGVTRREGKQAGADPTVTSLFDSIFGGKKTKSEELEEDSDEDTGGAAPGINKSHHAEDFYFTLDPIDTASSRMRDSLSTLVQLNKKGGFAKTFFGTNSYADPNQVFKVLSTALDGTKPIFSEQMDVLIRKYLSDKGFRNKAPWLPALVLSSVEVKSLEASPLGQKFLKEVLPNVENRAASIKELQQLDISPQIMNEFSSVMAKHTLVAPMISIRTGKDGQVYVNAFSQNRNALIKVVSEEFEKGMRSKLYHYDASTGDYTINEEAFTKGIEYLKELAQTEGDVLRDDFIVQMEAKLGITLSEDAVDTLFDNGIYLETTKTGRRVKFANSKMWNNNRSPFGIMQRHLESLLSKKTAYSIKGPTNFGAIDRLIKLEAHRSSAKRHGTTFFSGGRNIATMTSNKYFSNLLDDLFNLEEDSENPELSEKIVNKAHEIFGGEFEKPSQLLQAIYDGLITRENLEVQYINFSPLKQGKDSSDDFRRLEEAEHAAVKNGLMTYSTNITSTAFESSSEYSEGTHTFKMRQATIVPLTLSDKNTVMALKTLVPIMKFDPDGNISNSTVNLFVNNVVMSDINRIRAFASSNSAKDSADKNTSLTDVNNSSFEEGSLLFYLLPQLNNVMVEVDGVQRSLNEAVAAASLDSQMKELMPEIIKAVKPILNSMIDDKVEAFDPIDGIENYEHIPSAYKNMIMEQSSLIKPDGVDLLEFYKSNKVLMRMVAADITLGQALGTANTLQTFVGDIAQYYKPGKESTIREAYEQEDGSPETTAAIKATYENLDKRLASLIAPGVEPSRKNDNEEYIQIMVPDIMMDYDDEFFEGLTNEYLKAFKNTESTDGQEFVTWEEYLGNAVAFGEITQNVSDKITSLIKKYERGYIMKPEDKELLKKVMFNAQKPVAVSDYYTKIGSIGKTVRQRAYIKTSSVPLLPMFTKGTQLDNVRQAMENLQESQGMRVRLAFKSGVKVGYPAASKNASIVNSDGTVKSIEELTTLFKGNDETGIPYRKLKRKYWRIQQSVPNKKKDESTRGTQPDALIGAAASEVKGLKTVVEELTENANQLFKLRVEEIRGTLLMDNPDPNKKGEKIIDREKLGGMLKLVALERGFDFNVIEGLSVAEDGTFEVPAELSPASEQFQAMLLSIVRKGVAKKKVTGGSKVLMTEALFRFEEDPDQGEILYTSKYEGSLKPMRIETVVTEEGVSEVVQPAQIIIPNKMRLPNGKLIDFTKYIDKKTNRIDLSKLPEGALEGMGFRIPTQGYNSMAFVEVVGFLPDYMGDIVIAPRSFITQMGSDFDVDKLYEYFFKLETKKGSLVKVEDKVNNVDGQMEYTELGLQNAMLANRLTILKNNEVYRKIKKKLDFGLHTDVSNYKNTADEAMTKDINFYGGMANALEAKRKATSKSKRSVLSEFYQRKKYLEARSALDAVGVKASLNSFVGVITSTEKSINLIKPFTFGADAQVANIEGALTLRGTRLKQEVISGTLSAAVDNQNEQVINKYNLNNQTFDVHDALELMGFEEDFIQSFLEQPIILAVVAQVRKNEFETLNSVIEKTIAYFAKKEFGSDFSEIDVNKAVTKKFNAEFGDLSMDEVVAKLYNNVGKTFTEENNLLNIAMLEKFRHAKAIMSQLRPAVKILSGDSQGVGSTLAEFVGILQKVEELNGSDDGMPNVIDPTSVLGLMGKYLLIPRSSKIKIKNAKKKGFIPVGIIGGAQYLVKPDSVKAAGALHTLSLTNDLIMSEFSGMFNLINTVSSRAVVRGISVEGKKTISQGIRSYINSNADLFTEDEVTTTLEQLLYPTDTTMSLAEMLEVAKKDSRLKGNKLIQDLETAIEEDRPHTISFRNSANDDMVTDSQAIAFLDLLLTKSDTPIGDIGVTPKQLARKLIDYAFLTGGRKSAVDFVRFVPTSYLIDLGFFKTLKEGYAEIKGSEGAQHTNAMVQQILQHNPDLVTKRIRIKQEQSAEENEKGEGVVLNEDSSNGESIIFSPQKGLIEKAGISMGDTGLYMVHSSYDYIAVKPAGNPRRVLKFDHNTGNYVMLDNLGTGTISEYEFGKGTKESVLIENKSSTYFSNETASQENEEEIIPTEAGGGPTISITNQGTIPTESSNEDILTKIKNTFEPPSSDGPKEENPVKPPAEEKPSTTTTQPPKEEVDFDALFKSGSSKEKKEIPTSGEENQSLPSLAAVSKKLEGSNSGFYSPTESEVVQMLEEISESADMTHKYLAREILNSGVLGKKQFKLIFKSGNTLESNFNKQGQKVTINIDNNTSNWDFEQTVLHEIGHALTAFEIARFKDTPNSVSPKMKASLEKLDTLRKLFLKKLENKSHQEIKNYLAFTKDSESEIQDKIRELHAAGDVAAIQKILMAGYGASNLDEFVTMVMSNGAFRDMLDNTIDFNLTDGSVDKSLLVQIMSVLKDMFRQIFGLEKRKISEYALDQAMFVAKNQYTGTDTGYIDDSETVVTNGKQYTYNGSSVIDSASNVVTDKKILNQVERKLALSRNNSTKVSEGGKEYYVYEGFDKIEVARINKNGTVTKLKPAEADKIIPKAFVGSDGIITGGKLIPIPTTKIISGAQTGVDQLGLEVGKELGMETGGTATPGFVTEKGKDVSLKEKYGVEEITADLQKGQKGRQFYLPRTEENVKNSDGTVYFATDADSAGRVATERYAKKHNKPFILNPTAEQLRKFLADNNIKTLNVAGNRGSKLNPNQKGNIKNILLTALAKQPSSGVVKAPLKGVSNADIAEMSNEEYKELVKTGYTQWLDENGEVQEANYERPAQQTSGVEVVSRYTDADVKANPDKIYIFGDNTKRTGTGGQAQIRNNENAFGIATKISPTNNADAFMSDVDDGSMNTWYEANKATIDKDIEAIKKDGRPVVFPKDGLGTGLAKLKEKAPKTYAYLKQKLQEEFGFNNDTGVISQPTQPSSEGLLGRQESGEQGILEVEKAVIKMRMEAMLPPTDAFESIEEYEQAEAEVKASKEYKDLERQLTGQAKPTQQSTGTEISPSNSPKRSVIENTKFTYKGLNGESVTIETGFKLTEGQGAALEELVDFVINPKSSQKFEDLSMTLVGAAGTGKTTVIGFVKKIVDGAGLSFLNSPSFIYAAPTHAATVELTSATVKQGESKAASTIQSLGSMRVDRAMPAKGPMPMPTRKLIELSGVTNIIVIDEFSMLSRKDYQFLKEFALANSKTKTPAYRVIFMGDPQQLPEVVPGASKTKLVSQAFTDSPKVTLTEIKRTSDNDILEVLEEMRANVTGRVPVKEGATNIKYKRKAEGLQDYISKIKEDPEGTVYIGYTNKSVSEANKLVRESLGYDGGLKAGEVITGYLGFQSKQVTSSGASTPGLANSVRYTIEKVEMESDSVKGHTLFITSKSSKLAALAKAGVENIPKDGRVRTRFMPLNPSDSIALETELTGEQYEENNKIIASQLRRIHEAKQAALKNRSLWPAFYRAQQKTQKFFSVIDLGNSYIYNITTDRMEVFNPQSTAHKKAKSDGLFVEKGIDYGYAITIHKSQGSTIDNVFFDANTLPASGPAIVDKQGNRITQEAHALAYVAVSRAAKTLTVLGDRADKFYSLGKDKAPVIGFANPTTKKDKPAQSGDQGYDLFGNRLGLLPLQGTVDEFLRELDPAERRFFNQLSKEGKLKTICKLG